MRERSVKTGRSRWNFWSALPSIAGSAELCSTSRELGPRSEAWGGGSHRVPWSYGGQPRADEL